MSREWDILTSTRNYSPREFVITHDGMISFTGTREQVIKVLDDLLEQDRISYDTHTQLKNSLRGK